MRQPLNRLRWPGAAVQWRPRPAHPCTCTSLQGPSPGLSEPAGTAAELVCHHSTVLRDGEGLPARAAEHVARASNRLARSRQLARACR
eukprot:scaffold2421_cov390-Prasinococcus_capsulatus_cf.AAC.12